MRYKLIILSVVLPGFLTGPVSCRQVREEEEKPVRAVVPVTLATGKIGRIAEYTELTATSSFLVKAVIKSPVTGYVEKCVLSPGDKVGKNQILFEVRTRESAALHHDSLNPMGIWGLIKVKASIDGMVSVLDHPRGDFVQEDESLCTLVLPESLVFILEVPWEMNRFIHNGDEYRLMLPGNTTVTTRVHSALPTMSGSSQTRRIILDPDGISDLPENLIARVRIVRSLRPSAFILQKSCVLSDEIMKNFWVMKLVSDTIAVKIPVVTGIAGNDSIEIVSPVFSEQDRFLSSGNYGIGDTAVVRIIP